MNKRLLLPLAAAFLSLPAAASAQSTTSSPLFGKGTKLVSINLQTGGDYEGSTGLGGAFEVGVKPIGKNATLGLGVSIGLFSESASFGGESITTSLVPLMATGNIHFGLPSAPKLALYAGASAGYIGASVSADFDGFQGSVSESESGFGVQGGARFQLTNKLLAHGQLGFGDIPLITAGVSFKF